MANRDFLFRAKADTKNYDANLAKARQQLDGFAKANLSAGGAIKQLSGSLVSAAARFASVTAAVGALAAAFKSNISTAMGFEKSMSQLSSLTGMVGKDLEKLKGYAIELGSTTTLSASQVADAFKMIGSQQPQLLASGEALKAVTKNAITLAEAAGIDLATAAQTLSTSINQMGGDSANADRYINVLAAASQKGAGDIAWLGEAITKSGTTAKAVGTDYEELVANLEQLAKAGYDASTAGTALRSIIMNLEKKASNEFKPSIVGLTQAFENLGKANLTITEYQDIAGKMFAAQAKALADAAEEAKKMKDAITGTNTAEEQAKTNTDNLDGSLKSLASAWEGLNLHINDSNGLLRTCVDWLKDVVIWADKTFTAAGRASAQLERLRGGQQGSDNDIVQKDLNKVMSAPDSEKQALYEKIASTYTESESAKWRKVNETKSRLNTLGKYDPFGEKAKLEETIRKNTEWAEQFRILGEEFRSKGQKYLDSLKPVEEIIEPTQPLSDSETKKSKKSEKSVKPLNIRLPQKSYVQDFSSYNNIENKWYDSLDSVNSGMLAELKAIQVANINRFAEVNEIPLAFQLDESATQQQIQDALDNINMFMGENPIQINFSTGEIESAGKIAGKTWKDAASAVQSVGQAFSQIEDPAAKVAGTLAQAIASVALGYAEATTQAAKIGPWAWVAFAATGLAQMISTISTIKNVAHYAEGGIVGGNDYTDNTPIMVSSGELILNRAQQGNLASQLQEGNARSAPGLPFVNGQNIFLGTNNYLKGSGQGQLVTTQMLRSKGINI